MIKAFQNEIVFLTKRLIIRRISPKDFEYFHEMQSDAEVMKYAGGKPLNLSQNKLSFNKVTEAYLEENNTFWVWAIEDLKNKFLGTVALILDKENNWEIGYRLMKKYWGFGYATEVVEGLVHLANSEDTIHNLIAYADLRNPASQSVLNKNGFVNLGIKYNDIEDCEDYIYSINTAN